MSTNTLPSKQKISPIVAPQNRLSGAWKGGSKFDRFQHRRQSSGKQEDKLIKKRPKPQQELVKNKRLFDVDSPPTLNTPAQPSPSSKPVWKEKEKRHDSSRDVQTKDEQSSWKSKSRSSPTTNGPSKRPKIDRSKISNMSAHGQPKSHDSHMDNESRHSQPPVDGRAYSREPSKPRSRPSSRQSSRTSRSPVPLGHANRSPALSNPRDYSSLSEDEHSIRSSGSLRHGSHDTHMRWSKKDRSPDFTKERIVSHKHSKRREGHHTSRKHHEESHINRKNRGHHHYQKDEHWSQGDATDVRALNGKGDMRRQSYESISEDDLSTDHVSKDSERGEGKVPTPLRGGQNERKRNRPEYVSDSGVLDHHHSKVKRKKHKHSKEHVETLWRKVDSAKIKAHKH